MAKTKNGFTLVELSIIIAIICTLSLLGCFCFGLIQARSRDAESDSKITLISESLEKYYQDNGEYPSCSDMTQAIDVVSTNVLKGLNANSLTAPSAESGTNSIQCSDPSTSSQFGYISDGTQYTLKYCKEEDGSIVTLDSRYQDAAP